MEDERLDKIGSPLRDIKYHENCAIADIQGVMDCELMLVIMDSPIKSYSYRGTWTEIGARIGANKARVQMGLEPVPIILYNPWIDATEINDMAKFSRNVTNVFFWHPMIDRVFSGNKVFQKIEEYANPPIKRSSGGVGKQTSREKGEQRVKASNKAKKQEKHEKHWDIKEVARV